MLIQEELWSSASFNIDTTKEFYNMFEKKEVVFGVVIACSADNTLTVQLDNGETGVVVAEEIGRRSINAGVNCGWKVNRYYGFFAGEINSNGHRVLSGKAYEDYQYEQIVRSFRCKERNVYSAQLISVTNDGKLAFYMLAQGVNASLSLIDFAYTRVSSFHDIALPRQLTVAIKEIDSCGRIHLYAKLAFGDFAFSVERLGLAEGNQVEGFVSGYVPTNGDAVVTLAPNLTVLTSRAAMGDRVRVLISRVKYEDQYLKGDVIENFGKAYKKFCFMDWCLDATDFPAYVDVEEFDRKIGRKKRNVSNFSHASIEASEIQISYEITSVVSPFAIQEGEKAIRSYHNDGIAEHIEFETQHRYLNTTHMLVAKAINAFQYTTAWQIQRYLHLWYDLKCSESNLRTVINRLIKHDIIRVLRFSVGDKIAVTNILHPGAEMYQVYTHEPSSLSERICGTEPDPVLAKYRLSANQLLLGIVHGWNNVEEIDNKPCIAFKNGNQIRPYHKVVTVGGDIIYLESVRGDRFVDMFEKFEQYHSYAEAENKKFRVLITLEDERLIDSFVRKVTDMHLDFAVSVTCDLHCLPIPIMHDIPVCVQESRIKDFFDRTKRLFGK